MERPLPWVMTSLGPEGLPWRRRVIVVSSSTQTSWVGSGAGTSHSRWGVGVKSRPFPAGQHPIYVGVGKRAKGGTSFLGDGGCELPAAQVVHAPLDRRQLREAVRRGGRASTHDGGGLELGRA